MERKTPKWRIGDLGRFENEDSARPRFEVVAASKTGVSILYSGTKDPQVLPLKTFKYECVKWWLDQAFEKADLPKWFGPGAKFWVREEGANIIQAIVRDRRNYAWRHIQINVLNKELEVRRIQRNFASCTILGDGRLVMVPLQTIIAYGYIRITRWSKLQEDDEIAIPDDSEPMSESNGRSKWSRLTGPSII